MGIKEPRYYFTLMIMEFFSLYIDKDIYMLSMIILQTQQLTLQHRNKITQNIRTKVNSTK